ncbi:MAG TPA: hypothetical protein VJ644_02020 [Jiangellaceae bacterium]|nr:hypothetical protein [Jiangellaceae bacterium]
MSERSTRQILEDVAAGRLDPAEAAGLLDAAAGDVAGPPSPADSAAADDAAPERPAPPPAVPDIERVLVRATSRRVRVVGDPSVATYAVDGPHHVRREGSTLVIAGEVEPIPTDDAFTLLSGGRWREVADRVQHGLGQALEMRVRVRPDLAVGVEVIAGSLQVEDARALDHVRVTAGSLRVRGAESPFDLLVQAGSAQVQARLDRGRSRLRCESGSLQLTLLPGSDARVRSDVQLGRFATEPERHGRDRSRDFVVGTGAAEIDIEVVMGSATVKAAA